MMMNRTTLDSHRLTSQFP